jgi:O-antigen/teichoic acid export membrane protein
MSKIKTLAGDTVLYGLGNILPKAINFFLLIPHTHVFNPGEYGVSVTLFACVTFVNIVFSFGMETAYFRFSTKPGADPKKIFNLAETVVLGISVPLSICVLIFATPIAGALTAGSHPEYIRWIVLSILIENAVTIPFAKLRLERRPLKYSLAKLIYIGIVVMLNLIFLNFNYQPSIGIGYIFIANLVAGGFYLFFFARDLLNWRPTVDPEISPAMFKYAYPVMLGGLAYAINEMFSRLSLTWWLPEGFYPGRSKAYVLGIFGACYKYATLMNLGVQAFRFAAEPFFFSNASDKNSPVLFARVNHYFVVACCIVLLGVSINLGILKYFIGANYWEGLGIVPILLLAYLFLGMYYNFSIWYKITDRTYFGTIIFAGGALITIVLNYLLIPLWGYTGSSWASLLAYSSMAFACVMFGRKYYPIPYKVVQDFAYIAGTSLLIFIVDKIEIAEFGWSTTFHLGITFLYILTVYGIERKYLKPGGS